MRNTFKKSTLSLALATGLIGSTAWSTAAQACAYEPYLSAVCIMATPSNFGSFGQTYVPAMGQLLPIGQYQALAAIFGTTWGGDMRATIGLPDLRGRVVVGSGTLTLPPPSGTTQYITGQSGGAVLVSLTNQQLPAHIHTLSTVAVNTSKMTAATTLSGLSASLTGNLALKASSGGTTGNDPTGKSLATTTTGGPLKIYSDAAPTIVMNAGSIDSSGLAVGNFTGNPTTTLGGAATLSGTTDQAGASQPVPIMQPYLVMNYYVAANGGVFPTRD